MCAVPLSPQLELKCVWRLVKTNHMSPNTSSLFATLDVECFQHKKGSSKLIHKNRSNSMACTQKKTVEIRPSLLLSSRLKTDTG